MPKIAHDSELILDRPKAPAPVHRKQLLTYLRLADKRLGLLINFHVPLIKHRITRIVNGLEDETRPKLARFPGPSESR